MSVFGNIMSAIFGHNEAHAAESQPAPGQPGPATPAAIGAAASQPSAAAKTGAATASAAKPAAATPAAAAGATAGQANVDVAAVLDKLQKASREKFDWRKSIVDLMKLLNLDSSMKSRQALADELGYTGDKKDSAAMNVWLHKQVMTKLAANGGVVPKELQH
jgi:hypothetical protein